MAARYYQVGTSSFPVCDRQECTVSAAAVIAGRRCWRTTLLITMMMMMIMIPLLLLLIHLLCCTLARLTIRVGGAIAVALALPKQKTHKTATLACHRLHHINELKFPSFFFFFFSGVPSLIRHIKPLQVSISYPTPFEKEDEIGLLALIVTWQSNLIKQILSLFSQ